jgi:farnesyl-diphosphate farnesyltransferase
MTPSVNANQKAYLADQMNKVSRSFALVEPTVEEPLKDYLAAAYLICRVVDNIEDCTQPFLWKQQRFAEFATLLEAPILAREILTFWESEAWPGLSENEARMMGVTDGQMLWQIYAQIPEQPRTSIARWALEMAKGMEQVTNPHQTDFFFSRDGVRLPSSEDDYDRYCFYVAGTVGHMITELAIDHYGLQGETADRLLINSEASGRALQKINIVKDFAKDLHRGACFLPDEWLQEVSYTPLSLGGAPLSWKEKVLANVLVEFENSVNYVLDLPHSALGFRKASLLMMLPGYQTLLRAARNHDRLFTPAHNIKISRKTMARCLLDARLMVKNDDAILAYSRNAREELSKALASDRIKTHT